MPDPYSSPSNASGFYGQGFAEQQHYSEPVLGMHSEPYRGGEYVPPGGGPPGDGRMTWSPNSKNGGVLMRDLIHSEIVGQHSGESNKDRAVTVGQHSGESTKDRAVTVGLWDSIRERAPRIGQLR